MFKVTRRIPYKQYMTFRSPVTDSELVVTESKPGTYQLTTYSGLRSIGERRVGGITIQDLTAQDVRDRLPGEQAIAAFDRGEREFHIAIKVES